MSEVTYVVKIAQAAYLSDFLKMCTSENRTTEICRSQGPGVLLKVEGKNSSICEHILQLPFELPY